MKVFTLYCFLAFSIAVEGLKKKSNEELPRLNAYNITNPRAVCNDGSRAKYFLHRTESKNWVVYLQPGAFCHDKDSCLKRMNSRFDRRFTTSTLLSDLPIPGEGVLRTDSANRFACFSLFTKLDQKYKAIFKFRSIGKVKDAQ